MSKKTQTRRDLIDAFWLHYSSTPIERISVRMICERAGYNRSTFYDHFDNVYDLLRHIEDELIPSWEKLPPVTLPDGPIGMPVETFFDLFERDKEYYTKLLGSSGDPSFALRFKEAVINMLIKRLPVPQEEAELRMVLEYVVSGMIGVLVSWLDQGEPIPRAELYHLLERLLPQGIFAH